MHPTLLLTLLACASPDFEPCELEAPDPGALRAEGRDLVDALGRTVTLRGTNTGGRSKFAPYLPFDTAPDDAAAFEADLAAYLDRLVDWGFDVARVPFSWAALEPTPGQDDEAWLARYDALLDASWARGVWTIVDFHQDVYAEPFCGDGFPSWTLEEPGPSRQDCPEWFNGYLFDEDVAAAFDAFWQDAPAPGDPSRGIQEAWRAMWLRMAERHANRPGVLGYELINEPDWGTAQQETWASDTLAVAYDELTAAIQAVDPDALVFLDTTWYDGVTGGTDLPRPTAPNVVLAPHFYLTYLVAEDVVPDPYAVGPGLEPWGALSDAWDLPVLIGECGVEHSREGATPYVEAHVDAFDALGLHATWWEYSASEELWNDEDLSLVEADGKERAALLDGLLRPYVRALAGELLERTWDAAARTLTVRWRPTGEAPTELAFPARQLGDSPSVTGSGGCYAIRAGRVLVQPDPSAEEVTVVLGPSR